MISVGVATILSCIVVVFAWAIDRHGSREYIAIQAAIDVSSDGDPLKAVKQSFLAGAAGPEASQGGGKASHAALTRVWQISGGETR